MLVTVSSLFAAFSPGIILFVGWALLPYVALAFSSRAAGNAWTVGFAGAAAVAVEAGIRAAVFVFPQGSTAAIALVFSPFLVFIAMVGGAAFGWLFSRAPLLARVPLGAVGVGLLALTFVAFARPDQLPWAVAERRQVFAVIGEPRIVAGAGAFTRTVISDKSAWHQAGDLDGVPGDEIAVIDHDGAELIDPSDPVSRTTVPFGGQKGRLWDWYSRLRPIKGRLVVVQTGGGYQDTEVRTLDNQLLWQYQPEALVPSALKPGDLDGDGDTEFYASTSKQVARLDGDGRPVWTRPATLPVIADVAARSGSTPSWIVATTYGQAVHVWNDAGDVLATLPWPGAQIDGVVEWPDARRFVVTGAAPAVVGIDGHRINLPPVEHMSLEQARSVRWAAGSTPVLATVWTGPRDVERWRLRLIDASGAVVYDEVVDRRIALHVATDARGLSHLLVSGRGLSSLRPVDP
jgi:hypothetical protein